MRPATIETKLVALQADRDSIDWTERAALVEAILEGSSRARSLSAAELALVEFLAVDPKWEVRMAVCGILYKLSENDFPGIAAKLTSDDNAYVKAAAERALARRRRGHAVAAKRVRGLDRVDDELHRLEKKHGVETAALVRDMAQRMYEGLVGASVHEMRSVVTAMKVNLEQLERAAESETQDVARRVCPRLIRSVAFLERLLDDMRDYTRSPTRERATEKVIDLIVEAGEMVQAEFAATGRNHSPVKVEGKVPKDLVIHVSRDRIVLALRNLIKNAYDAFMIDEVRFNPGKIEIFACGGSSGVRISIKDNGMGLSPDELEAVRQFIPGRSSKAKLGTGFGLPIARKNIRSHGGDLRIESEEDKGTEVVVWLPAEGRATK
jgi:signal transduction histidine kinase